MKLKINKKHLKKTLVIIFLLTIIAYSITDIFIPAWQSWSAVCIVNYQQNENIVAVGQTEVNEEGQIIITLMEGLSPEFEKIVKKHEHVHKIQHQRGFLKGNKCDLEKYFAEVEAYVWEDVPDLIYKPAFGDYE